MTRERDFLDEQVAERTRGNPLFPLLLEAARERRALLRRLAELREQQGLSQTVVAARMGTSQSALARLEAAEDDLRMSTIERYAAALGRRIEWRIRRSA